MDKFCRVCNEHLVIGNNWSESRKKYYNYVCISCDSKSSSKWAKGNRDKMRSINKKCYSKIPSGVYEILYKGVRCYIGQSKTPYRRITKHFSILSNLNEAYLRSPVSYRLSIGEIKRKDLSYNMLQYEDDEQRRLEIERDYIKASTGLWNKVEEFI